MKTEITAIVGKLRDGCDVWKPFVPASIMTEAADALESAASRTAELEAKCEAMEKDAGRLDYLDSIKIRNGSVVQFPINAFMPLRDSVDDAMRIDAAIDKEMEAK